METLINHLAFWLRSNRLETMFYAIAAVLGFYACSQAKSETNPYNYLINVDQKGVILDGYDPVAFFTDNKPQKGSQNINSTYNHAIYQFASQAHKEMFDADPARYEPQFGAYCAYAVSLGRTAPIDVNTFSIVEGRLVIQHNERAVKGWEKDPTGNLHKADKYWPRVVMNNGKQIKTEEDEAFLVNVDKNQLALDGFDPVAYFTEGKPIKGQEQFQTHADGSTYYFSSAQNLEMFKDNPAKYAPAFGGFCAYAIGINRLRPIDAKIYRIVDGKIYFQNTKKALELFDQDVPGNIQKAHTNWPALIKKHAGKPVKYDPSA